MEEKEFNKMMDKREETKVQKEKMKRFEEWEKNQGKKPLPELPPKYDIPKPPEFKPQEPMVTQSNQKLPKIPKGYVAVKACALEVMKTRKLLNYACFGGAVLPFLILAFSSFSFTMGAGLVMLMVIGYVFLLMQNKKEIQYLNQQYKI